MTMTQTELRADVLAERRDDTQLPWPVRQLVLARDNWACLCCGKTILGRAYAIQLRKPWHLGGDISPQNLITVRAECGDRITLGCDPADQTRGYEVGPADDPASVPVTCSTMPRPAKVWLLPDGGRAFERPRD
jgi:hypothetical protein